VAVPIRLRARLSRAAGGAVLLLCGALAACRQAPLAERLAAAVGKPNLLLVTLDTTRADHISSYGYSLPLTPNLDRLAHDGARFRSCTTPSAFTQAAHASILTGTYPAYHGVRINGQAALASVHRTLAEVLADAGYATAGFVGAFVLDGRWGLDQGFAHYDDRLELGAGEQIDLASIQRPANEVVDAALAWLAEPRSGPFFAWVHLYDAHAPYAPPEPYASRYGGRGLAGLYDGEIAFADEQVGRLLAWLGEHGLAENTVVAVIGDHGEALGSHGELTHGYFLYDYATQVPLVVHVPRGLAKGIEVAAPVRSIDLFPTLLELAGQPVPPAVQGRSLVPLLEGRADQPPREAAYSESMAPFLQYGWSPMFSLRHDRYLYVDAPQPELYDVAADPEATVNLIDRDRPRARAMRSELERLHAAAGASAPQVEEANLDSETLAKLAALGYVASSAAASRGGLADPALADPKQKLPIYSEVSLAGDLVNRSEWAAAAQHLEAVLAQDPGVEQAKLLLATCYVKTQRVDEAHRLLDAILSADPDNVQALVAMASLLAKLGRHEEMAAVAKRALAVDERNTQAYLLLGDAAMERGDAHAALPYLRRAVEIQPKLLRNRQNLAACLIRLEEFAEAESILRAVLAEHPRFPLAHFHLGLIAEQTGRRDEARAQYLAEIQEAGESVPARFNLGNLALAQGDEAEYRAQMEKVIELAPERARGYLFLARGLLREPGEMARAAQLAQRGLELADTAELKALAYFVLADVYARQGDGARLAHALAEARRYAAQAEKGAAS
jgi:choline-sulfatase